MSREEWDSDSDSDDAPEEENVMLTKKQQQEQHKREQERLQTERSKQKALRRETQQRRELEKLEKQKKSIIQQEELEEDEVPDELPEELLENLDMVKPTKVVFNEEQEAVVPRSLLDIKRERVAKLRQMRQSSQVKTVDGNIRVKKITKESLRQRKVDTGVQSFKTEWLNRRK